MIVINVADKGKADNMIGCLLLSLSYCLLLSLVCCWHYRTAPCASACAATRPACRLLARVGRGPGGGGGWGLMQHASPAHGRQDRPRTAAIASAPL